MVCDKWVNDFPSFLSDMGKRPSPKHSIERIDNNGNYEPSNCRWATNKEQGSNTSRNRIVRAFDENLTLGQWASRSGLKRETIARRLNSGWTPEDAVTVDVDVRFRAKGQ